MLICELPAGAEEEDSPNSLPQLNADCMSSPPSSSFHLVPGDDDGSPAMSDLPPDTTCESADTMADISQSGLYPYKPAEPDPHMEPTSSSSSSSTLGQPGNRAGSPAPRPGLATLKHMNHSLATGFGRRTPYTFSPKFPLASCWTLRSCGNWPPQTLYIFASICRHRDNLGENIR